MFDLISRFAGKIPLLGICLGMQAINEHFGGTIKKDIKPCHGKVSKIVHQQEGALLSSMPSQFNAARYHSLVIDDLAKDFFVCARTLQGIPMAIEHKDLAIYGVQFHPESFLSEYGSKVLEEFFSL